MLTYNSKNYKKMKQTNASKRKRNEAFDDGYEAFTSEEHEVSKALLLLQTAVFRTEEGSSKLKKKKRSCKGKTPRVNCNIHFTSVVMNNNIHLDVAVDNNINNVNNNNNGYNPPDLPPFQRHNQNIISHCGMPFEKQLKDSDLKKSQNRLFLNKSHVEKHFLFLLREEENVKAGIPVIVYDTNMHDHMFSMKFKLWANKYYVLMEGWKTFVQSHSLQKIKDYVTVWMFRHAEDNQLCFALSIRRQDNDQEEG